MPAFSHSPLQHATAADDAPFLPHFAERALLVLPRLFGVPPPTDPAIAAAAIATSSSSGTGISATSSEHGPGSLEPPTVFFDAPSDAIRALQLEAVVDAFCALLRSPAVPRHSTLCAHAVATLIQVLLAIHTFWGCVRFFEAGQMCCTCAFFHESGFQIRSDELQFFALHSREWIPRLKLCMEGICLF